MAFKTDYTQELENLKIKEAYNKGFADGFSKAVEAFDYQKRKEQNKETKPEKDNPYYPYDPYAPKIPDFSNQSQICSLCGANLKDLTHYVCMNTNCPVFLRAVW